MTQDERSVPLQIWDAIRSGELAQQKHLFAEHPAEINGYTFFGGGTYLHFAASHGDLATVQNLVSIGFDVNKPGKNEGDLALTNACGRGHLEIARYLLDQGSLIDTSETIRNPLFSAICGYANQQEFPREAFFRVAMLLLDRGIDAAARYTGRTMIDMDAAAFAVMWGRADIARAILERLHPSDPEGFETALKDADIVAHGNTGTMKSRKLFRQERRKSAS